MKRREFLKEGAVVAAGFVTSEELFKPLDAEEESSRKSLLTNGQSLIKTTQKSGGHTRGPYPNNEQNEQILPKLPRSFTSFQSADQIISPMPRRKRASKGILPKRGFCSIAPGSSIKESLLSGNGKMYVESTGNPFSEEILFHQERLLVPWPRPFEAPKVASILPELRKLLLDGRYREGLNFAFEAMRNAGLPMNVTPHQTIPAFFMHIEIPRAEPVTDYLRTLNFENGEVKVHWKDPRGEWVRQLFVSRPDDVVVQLLTAPNGQSVNAKIALTNPPVPPRQKAGPITFDQDCSPERLVFLGRFNQAVNNNGYAGVTRVVRVGGSAQIQDGTLVIKNAQSVLLLTRIEWYSEFTPDKVEMVSHAVDEIKPEYTAMLMRNQQTQGEVFNRVSVDFGGESQYTMAAEELLDNQRSRTDYSPALLEKMFDMGRYWFMLSCGHYPVQPMEGEVNININLQVSGGTMGDMPEAMASFYNWIESLFPDCRKNAENIFGARGAVFPILPNKEIGVSFLYASHVHSGIWPHPYWISAGGWLYHPFWDHYLVTGDLEFLRKRVVPGLKELALFYEDFLKVTDENGNYVFVPSFSPENWPTDAEPPPVSPWPLQPENRYPEIAPYCPLVINADMDIMVCREVLTHLIEASSILKTDVESVPKWKAMLAKMPPYVLDRDGALKEWAWPMLEDHLNHRHISHLYAVWPGDEIDPDRTPELAKAALLAVRKRPLGDLAAHGLLHRALAGARLKDSYEVDFELRQLLELGYVGPTLRTSHGSYTSPMPDAQGSLPTIIMEMLVYSRLGVIELLPALPTSLKKGSIQGMLTRTFARVDKLTWDTETRTEDLTLTSNKEQIITLIVRHGIKSIIAPTEVLVEKPEMDSTFCRLRLPKGKPVTLHIKFGQDRPLDWATDLASG